MTDNTSKFTELARKATQIKASYSERDSMYTEIEKIIFLEDDNLPNQSWIKKTFSTDPLNKYTGAVRMLSSAAPIWTYPYDETDDAATQSADKLEKFADACWKTVGQIRMKPIERDLAATGLMYDEIHLAVMTTKDLVSRASEGEKARMERIAKRTPIMFEVLSPKICYPLFDGMGLSSHYAEREMAVADVLSRWGDAAVPMLPPDLSERVTYCEFWDSEWHAVWISGRKDPLLCEQHGLDQIPIASAIIEGSEQFQIEGQQNRRPFLYSTWKSGMWNRQNLALTAIYSSVFQIASFPMLHFKSIDPMRPSPVIDFSGPVGIVRTEGAEDLGPLQRQAIDPSMMTALEISKQSVEEQTIYGQTLGAPLSGSPAFSLVAMLQSTGKLPLVPYQQMISSVIGNAMSIALMLVKSSGGASITYSQDRAATNVQLQQADIPDNCEISASLEITMPTDERMNAQIAEMLVKAELASKAYAREHYLKIGQSGQMDEAIWSEQMATMRVKMAQEEEVNAFKMRMQMQQQMMQQGMQQPGGPGQMQPGGMPPEMQGGQPGQLALPQEAAQQGLPMSGPMTPQGMPGEQLPPEGMPPMGEEGAY